MEVQSNMGPPVVASPVVAGTSCTSNFTGLGPLLMPSALSSVALDEDSLAGAVVVAVVVASPVELPVLELDPDPADVPALHALAPTATASTLTLQLIAVHGRCPYGTSQPPRTPHRGRKRAANGRSACTAQTGGRGEWAAAHRQAAARRGLESSTRPMTMPSDAIPAICSTTQLSSMRQFAS
jgi:hypothetical protein